MKAIDKISKEQNLSKEYLIACKCPWEYDIGDICTSYMMLTCETCWEQEEG